MSRIGRIIVLVACCWMLLFIGRSEAVAASQLYEDNQNGVLTIEYNNTDGAKMKIAVSKGDKSYYYNLVKGKNTLDIPLTMGNGIYKIRICKNITGTKYSIIQSETYQLDLENEDEVYLHSNVIVDYTVKDPPIKKADALTKNKKVDMAKIETIYNYVVKNYLYDYKKLESLSSGYIPNINIIYKNKKGICYDISAIIAAMMRSEGIQVKLVTGYTPNVDVYHAWNMIYDEKSKQWITVDATYDLSMYQAGKKYKMKKPAKDYKDIVYQY